VPQVVRSVQIPVIASGGIVDGLGLVAALALGAEGIEMGTRFIATKECVHAHPVYKEAIIKAKETDTVIIKRSLGTPARALKNPITDRILSLEAEEAGYEGLKEYISGETNRKLIHEGKWDEGFGWAGQGVGLIEDIPSVKELFEHILSDVERAYQRLNRIKLGY
jgi:NAD(P)H-dependent flavin oxidoreductase YrpB (nitropropane dioxygenase family)